MKKPESAMTLSRHDLRAANLYSLILLGIGCLMLLSTAMVQAEVLATWDPASPLAAVGAPLSSEEIVIDPTGGLILKRYLIGGIYLACGMAAHAWIRASRKAMSLAAAV